VLGIAAAYNRPSGRRVVSSSASDLDYLTFEGLSRRLLPFLHGGGRVADAVIRQREHSEASPTTSFQTFDTLR
jgi:hypothetical protein